MDLFAFGISIDGDVLVAGAPSDDDLGSSAGAAYVFRYDGSEWIQEQKLTASDGEALDSFGSIGVAVQGDVIVIGATGDDDLLSSAGAAYVFRYNGSTWDQERKLLASDGNASDYFGNAVAGHGDVFAIGAHLDEELGTRSGSVYVFRNAVGATWTEEQKLTASDGGVDDKFGFSVSVDSDTIVVGAPRDVFATGPGAVYVFRYNGTTWIEEQKLTASDGESGGKFGYWVSADADLIIVGAFRDDDNGIDSGAAYLFRHSGGMWIEEQKLTAADGDANDQFGLAVAVRGGTAFVGAYGDEGVAEFSGSTYLFCRAGSRWMANQKLVGSDARRGSQFGRRLAVTAERIAVSAHGDDDNGQLSGAAYVYEGEGPVSLDVAMESLVWCVFPPDNLSYDIVRGDLQILRTSGGDFNAATHECLSSNQLDPSLMYDIEPAPGAGIWFLVRARTSATNGTYDSGGNSQVEDRDAEIAASGSDCPP